MVHRLVHFSWAMNKYEPICGAAAGFGEDVVRRFVFYVDYHVDDMVFEDSVRVGRKVVH